MFKNSIWKKTAPPAMAGLNAANALALITGVAGRREFLAKCNEIAGNLVNRLRGAPGLSLKALQQPSACHPAGTRLAHAGVCADNAVGDRTGSAVTNLYLQLNPMRCPQLSLQIAPAAVIPAASTNNGVST